jgi:hypothetical protein
VTDQPPSTEPPSAPAEGPFKGRTANRFYRWASIAIGVAGVILAVIIVIGNVMEIGKLPGCDSDGARDTLSDVFKANKIEATAYDTITTVSSTDEEVTCTAVLSLKDGNKLDVAYRFYFEEKQAKYEVTSLTEEQG